MDRAAFAVAGQGAGPLTQHQVRSLVLLARRAYAVQRSLGLAEEEPFDEWRHAAVADAAPGRPGLKLLRQEDFCAVRDYLKRLAGGSPAAASAREAREDDSRRRALWALRRECVRLADAFDGGAEGAVRYAASIVRKETGAAPEAASPVALWRAVYTLRSRAKARRAKQAAESRRSAPGAPEGEMPPRKAPRVFPLVSRAGTGIPRRDGT